MSENYTKADLRHIAKWLIEDLRECEDGTSFTTRQLVEAAGYEMDEFREGDLLRIHNALFKAAKADHFFLDMSRHYGSGEGLPYDLEFVVHNRKAQIKCPHCGSRNTARYIYGYPMFNEKMQKNLEAGKWVLGGCGISIVEINGKQVETMPARKCNECKKDFATAPILLTPKKHLAEDYRDIVTSIKFHVGGFFGRTTEITIKKDEDGALVKTQKYFGDYQKRITRKKWRKILNKLYCKCYLHEWKKEYDNPDVLDGEMWNLDINLTNKRVRHYSGCNAYPPYWKRLEKIFKKAVKI